VGAKQIEGEAFYKEKLRRTRQGNEKTRTMHIDVLDLK
jgi:hypothetical protein